MTGTGQYRLEPANAGEHPGLDPGLILERASVKPKVVETKPKKPSRSRNVVIDEDEPNLIAAK